MAHYKRPRRKDKGVSQRVLNNLIDGDLKRTLAVGGMSDSPAGLILPDLSENPGHKLVYLQGGVYSFVPPPYPGLQTNNEVAYRQGEYLAWPSYWGPGSDSSYTDACRMGAPMVNNGNLYNAGDPDGDGLDGIDTSLSLRKYQSFKAVVWNVDGNDIRSTGEEIRVINLSSFFFGGWAIVAPLDGQPDLYVIVNDLQNQSHLVAELENTGTYPTPGQGYGWDIDADKGKLLKLTPDAGPAFSGYLWMGGKGILRSEDLTDRYHDAWIFHPGSYQIHYGIEVAPKLDRPYPIFNSQYTVMPSTDLTVTSGAASAGTAHDHPVTIPRTAFELAIKHPSFYRLRISFHLNWRPDGNPYSWDHTENSYENGSKQHTFEAIIPALMDCPNRLSATTCIFHGWNAQRLWENSPNLRCRIGVAVQPITYKSAAGTPAVHVSKVFCVARPIGYNGNYNGSSTNVGYNYNAGPKTPDNPNGYRWWGGGPPPMEIDEDGLEV